MEKAGGPRLRGSEVLLEALTPPPWLRVPPQASPDRGGDEAVREHGVIGSHRRTLRRGPRASASASCFPAAPYPASTSSRPSRLVDGESGKPKLLDLVREALRLRHYSVTVRFAHRA